MIYIYDILLNFQKDIYEYYEWKKEDVMAHVKRIKLFKVASVQMEDFFNYDIKIDLSFLELISNSAEIYHKSNIDACLFTDGYRVLAITFNGNGRSLLKSRLLLEEEEEILGISDRLKDYDFSYKKVRKYKQYLCTRTEKKDKEYLLKRIKSIYKNKKYSFLEYLYLEYFGETLSNYNEMYKDLINSLDFINKKHKRLIEVLELANKKKSKI